ncbi:MAG: PspC domain-containing protein [Candidatus Nanoarchaeia archaeon]
MVKKKIRKKKASELEKRLKDFGEEVEKLGEKISEKTEEVELDSWFHRTFGFVGPLISSIFGILVFLLLSVIIKYLNIFIQHNFLSDIYSFMISNAFLFFLVFIFFSYSSYFSKVFPKSYKLFSPILIAVSAVIALWLMASVFDVISIYIPIKGITIVSYVINQTIVPIFWFFLFIGYISLGFMILKKGKLEMQTKILKQAKKEKQEKIRRLYRSGKDKILGGVCGGLGEYFGVDPVLIRILWVLLTLIWGFGIILYIICWIIIPRNPKHKWED